MLLNTTHANAIVGIGAIHLFFFEKKHTSKETNKTTVEVIHPSGQITMIPKTELRAVWEDSLT